MKEFTDIEKMHEELHSYFLDNRMSPKYTKIRFSSIHRGFVLL